MAVTKSDATDKERANYIEAALTTERSIGKLIAQLQTREMNAGPDESRTITVEVAKLEAERALVRADLTAFLAETTRVNPPSDNDLAKIQALATQIDGMIAKDLMAKDLLGIATQVATAFGKTRA